jgi:eukaryotic-like serine/threonine-protein kinase
MITDLSQPLAAGSKLGQFTIHSQLGAGGMGEVYEAEDTRLHRRVALKVIRRDVAADPVRRARLEREASAVAMLNHPNIVTVHSLEEHEGALFITMELIEGSTLAAALPEGGFPLERLLRLSLQLADALAAAHECGIVHRDLKPANIMITQDGAVKVLDFGLSRLAVHHDPGEATADILTRDDHLVGTAPYMSPEQIEGNEADTRSDIFALGVVMFEMATGKRPFMGPTPLATLTSIVKDEAPFASTVNPQVPQQVARMIDRCLTKPRARRMQSAVDLRGQLDDLLRMLESGVWDVRTDISPRLRAFGRSGPIRLTNRAAFLSVAVPLAAAGLLWVEFGRESTSGAVDRRVTRFSIDLPKGTTIGAGYNRSLALSPDGSQLGLTPFPGPVYIRRFDRLEAQPLESAASPGFRGGPVFSPDGSTLSFIEGNGIISSRRPFYKAALSGGATVKLADYDAFHEGDWASDGWIYYTAAYPGGIVRVRESGGSIEPVTELDVQHGERSHRFARLLPGGNALIYTVAFDGISNYDDARIDAWDLKTRQHKTLITGATSAAYSPSGHLVYARAGKLFAAPFDVSRLQVTGASFPVVDGVIMSGNTGVAQFSVSLRGDLAYAPGSAADGHRTLVWVDRSGKEEPLPLPPSSYLYPRLSPDGHYLAVEMEGPNHDLYIYDFARSVLTKITTDGLSHDPVWTPDGKRIVFRSWQAGGMTMWTMPVDRSAAATRLDPTGNRQSPVSISPDGRFLSFDQKDAESGDDAWVLPLEGRETAQPVARSRFDEGSAKFSPDGRWIAYSSAESGRPQVYIQPFPGPGPKVQVSNDPGTDPQWRRTGGELYYRSRGRMMVVSVATSPTVRVTAPRELWAEPKYTGGSGSSCGMPGVTSSNYDVTPDGQRFLMVRDDDVGVASSRVVVVMNWAEELKESAGRAATTRTARQN